MNIFGEILCTTTAIELQAGESWRSSNSFVD